MKRVNGMLLHELGRYINRVDSIPKNSTYREAKRKCLICMTGVKQFVFDGEFAGMFDLCRKPAQELIVRNPADREHSFWLNVNTDSGSS